MLNLELFIERMNMKGENIIAMNHIAAESMVVFVVAIDAAGERALL